MAATSVTIKTETMTAIASPLTSLITTSDCYTLTYAASRGETIYLSRPSDPSSSIPTAKVDPTYPFIDTLFKTITETQFVVVLNDHTSSLYSTITIIPDAPSQTPLSTPYSNVYAYVIGDGESTSGWDSWSKGEQAGLVIGVVFAALLILLGLFWFFKQRNEWVAHDWRFARGVEGGNQGLSVAPTVPVNGPLDARDATPYGYGGAAGHLGWGYIRGGDGELAYLEGRRATLRRFMTELWKCQDAVENEVEARQATNHDVEGQLNTVAESGEQGKIQTSAVYQTPVVREGKRTQT